MLDPSAVASELDAIHACAKVAYCSKDLDGYMRLFAPNVRYRQLDGRVIGRERLRADVGTQLRALSAVRSNYVSERFEIVEGQPVETLIQAASCITRAFGVVHRSWTLHRKARYVWQRA